MASQKRRLDALSQDILEDDFINIFSPVNYVSRVLGVLRVDVRYKFATPPSVCYQLYSVLIRLVDILTSIEYVLNCETIFNGTTTDLLLKVGTMATKVGNSVVALRNVMLEGRLNTLFFVKLQKMDRGLIPCKAYLNKRLAERTLKMTVIATALSAAYLITYSVYIPTARCSLVPLYLTCALNLSVYPEIILSIIAMYYIGIRVAFLNTVLEKELQVYGSERKVYNCVWMVGGPFNNVKFSDQTVKSLYCILDAMTDWLNLFQYPIFNFMIVVFGTNMVVVESYLSALKDQMGEYRSTLYLCPMFLFTAVQVILSLLAGAVSSNLRTTKRLCNHIAYTRPEGAEGKTRDVAKRMIVLLNSRRDMTVYNIFSLNSRLPLNLLGFIASYAIVLFQFALL